MPDAVRNGKDGPNTIVKRMGLRMILLANGNFIRPEGLELPEAGAHKTFGGHMRGMFAKSLAKIAVVGMLLYW